MDRKSDSEQGFVSLWPTVLTLGWISMMILGVLVALSQFGFEVASKGTPAEDAELEIVEVPLVVHCDICDTDSETGDSALLRCPKCAGQVTVVSGNETLVTSVRYAEA